MSTVQPPFPACAKNQPFLFVSYAHRDSERVYPDIARLHAQGYRVWYDEGIDPGSEWPEDIADALNACSLFILFVSPNAVASRNVRNEIHLAISRDKPLIAIHLQETEMPSGLELQLGGLQAIMRFRESEEQYWHRLEKALLPFGNIRSGETKEPLDIPAARPRRRRALAYSSAATVAALGALAIWYFAARPGQNEAGPARAVPDTLLADAGTSTSPPATERVQVAPSSEDTPPESARSRTRRAPRIPRGAIICSYGEASPGVQRAIARSLSQNGVRKLGTPSGTREDLRDLVDVGTLPESIESGPAATTYIAIDTWVAIEDSTFWMASAGGQVVVANVSSAGVSTSQFMLSSGQTGVQPNRSIAMQMLYQDLVGQNSATIQRISELAKAAQ